MLNCIIVDDEQHSIDVLEHYVTQSGQLRLIASTTNPLEALDLVNQQPVDLMFLDVHMPELSGLDVIKTIAGRCRVILTTAYQEYAIAGYDLGVVDYLLKPISHARFLQAIQKVSDDSYKVAEATGRYQNYIYVKTGLKNNVIRIDYNDIEYIESLKNYAAIFHAGKKTVAYLSMKDLEVTLPAERFLRIHKSYIVALPRIARVEGNEVELIGNKTRINIGDSYKTRFWNIVRERTLGK